MEKSINLKEIFKESDKYIGKKVKVTGWIRTNRDSKTFGFIVLSDGTTPLQKQNKNLNFMQKM